MYRFPLIFADYCDDYDGYGYIHNNNNVMTKALGQTGCRRCKSGQLCGVSQLVQPFNEAGKEVVIQEAVCPSSSHVDDKK